MEKLLTLLNEFDKLANPFTHYKKWWYWDCVYENHLPSISHLILISKSYWFIWWLVENNKIDLDKVKDNSELYIKFSCNDDEKWTYTKIILMLLSIQDNPIEFLISILK